MAGHEERDLHICAFAFAGRPYYIRVVDGEEAKRILGNKDIVARAFDAGFERGLETGRRMIEGLKGGD